MLVYCNNLVLNPTGGIAAVATRVAAWAGKRSKGFVDPKALLCGASLRLKDGSRISCESNVAANSPLIFPALALINLTHSDTDVAGRRWSTEIGIRQNASESATECSVFLETHESGAWVNASVQVTRPRIVEDLVDYCAAAPDTAGLHIKDLRTANAGAFLKEVANPDRKCALVVVSSTSQGTYLVNVDRLRSLTIGLAQIFVIPYDEDTKILEKELTQKYAAYLGAVNVIFPVSRNQQIRDAYRYIPDQLEAILDDGRHPESEILSTITHRLSLPNSWRRITSYVVADAKFRTQLEAAVERAKESQRKELTESHETELQQLRRKLREKTTDLNDFLDLTNAEIETKNKEIESSKRELTELNETIEDQSDLIRELQASNEALKTSLERQSNEGTSNFDDNAIRESVAASLKKGIGVLEDVLRLVERLYPDRLVVLDSAHSSARHSRAFKSPERALDLLLDLAGEYWQKLTDGKGDGEAKKVFGSSYAANEAEVLKKEALKRRTFWYQGKQVAMLKHLKIGVKDSVAETLRIHFEWFADEKKIVIGHCGKHLKL